MEQGDVWPKTLAFVAGSSSCSWASRIENFWWPPVASVTLCRRGTEWTPTTWKGKGMGSCPFCWSAAVLLSHALGPSFSFGMSELFADGALPAQSDPVLLLASTTEIQQWAIAIVYMVLWCSRPSVQLFELLGILFLWARFYFIFNIWIEIEIFDYFISVDLYFVEIYIFYLNILYSIELFIITKPSVNVCSGSSGLIQTVLEILIASELSLLLPYQ